MKSRVGAAALKQYAGEDIRAENAGVERVRVVVFLLCIIERALAAETDINSKAVRTLRIADKRSGLRAVICAENSLFLFFYALFEHGGSFAFADSLRCFFVIIICLT